MYFNPEVLKAKVVAIDGPVGSGKSSVAKLVAKNLGFTHIDSGAMYRSLAFYFHQHGIDCNSNELVAKALVGLKFIYRPTNPLVIEVGDLNLQEEIRQHFVSSLASQVARYKEVRSFLLNILHLFGQNHFCVMEGRDIGSVVFPNAFIKFFLTASAQVRAQRRLSELQIKGENGISFEKMVADIIDRDRIDSNRPEAPLIQSPDALLIDTSQLSLQDVVDRICIEVKLRASEFN